MEIRNRIQLVDLLKEMNMLGPVAEIGVAEGNFSRDLLVAGVPHLYMVDNWATIPSATGDGSFPQNWHDKNFREAKQKVKAHWDRVTILKGLSIEMWERVEEKSLSMVYIDADHSFVGAYTDLTIWTKRVKPGGIVAGHDYLCDDYGVFKAVNDFTKKLNVPVFTIPENHIRDASFYFIKPLD